MAAELPPHEAPQPDCPRPQHLKEYEEPAPSPRQADRGPNEGAVLGASSIRAQAHQSGGEDRPRHSSGKRQFSGEAKQEPLPPTHHEEEHVAARTRECPRPAQHAMRVDESECDRPARSPGP